MSVHVDAIRWTPEPNRLADQVLAPTTEATVIEWCKELQRAADARMVTLTQEEQNRRENKTPKQVLDETVDKAVKKALRTERQQTTGFQRRHR